MSKGIFGFSVLDDIMIYKVPCTHVLRVDNLQARLEMILYGYSCKLFLNCMSRILGQYFFLNGLGQSSFSII
jgi:hypothetical protein